MNMVKKSLKNILKVLQKINKSLNLTFILKNSSKFKIEYDYNDVNDIAHYGI